MLQYLEIPIVKHCNLNCRYCSHLSNIEDKYFISTEIYKRDVIRLSQLFSDINEMRLLGGEPLLHPHIVELIKTTREVFPKTELKVATNGLLIPSVDKEVLRAFSVNNVSFDISLYPPTQKIQGTIRSRLFETGVRFYFSEPISKFQKRLLLEPVSNKITAWNKCKTKNCFVLFEGKMSYCYAPQLAELVNKKCGCNFEMSDAIVDIYDEKCTGNSLLDFLLQPHSCCSYCGEPETYDWTTVICKPNISDWVVENPIQ